MKNGWISIWRRLQHHWIWDDKPFSRAQAWIDLIMRATHKNDKTVLFLNRTFTLARGELVTSLRFLAKEWGWSKNKVSGFLNDLERDQMIERPRSKNRDRVRDSQFTRILIVNYERFQPQKSEGRDSKRDTRRTRVGQQRDRNNNDNNVNNGNKKDIRPKEAEYDALFEIFWKEYPNHKAKKKALQSWYRLKPTLELTQIIVEAVRKAKESPQWKKDNGQFIPHPTTYLNQERWNDELESPKTKVGKYDHLITKA